jgi:hypothetical protein
MKNTRQNSKNIRFQNFIIQEPIALMIQINKGCTV